MTARALSHELKAFTFINLDPRPPRANAHKQQGGPSSTQPGLDRRPPEASPRSGNYAPFSPSINIKADESVVRRPILQRLFGDRFRVDVGTKSAAVGRDPLVGQRAARDLYGRSAVLSADRLGEDEIQARGTINADTALSDVILSDGASAATFEALYYIHRRALQMIEQGHGLGLKTLVEEGHRLRRKALYAFSVARYRSGKNIGQALEALNEFDRKGAVADLQTVLALAHKADIRMGQGKETEGKYQRETFTDVRRLLVTKIPELLEQMDELPVDVSRVLADIYYHAAVFFLDMGYTAYGLELGRLLCWLFPDSRATQEMLSESSPLSAFLVKRDGARSLRPLTENQSLWDRLKVTALEMVHHTDFSTGTAGYVMTGLFGGAAVAAGDTFFVSGGLDYFSALTDVAIGATGAVALAKFTLGAFASETRQAWRTGYTEYTRKDLFGKLSREAAKLVGTYALFGGALPVVGAADHLAANLWNLGYDTAASVDVLREYILPKNPFGDSLVMAATDGWNGSFYSLGSIQAWAVSGLDFMGRQLVDFVGSNGLWQGAKNFVSYVATDTAFGQSLSNGADLVGRGVALAGHGVDLVGKSLQYAATDPSGAASAASNLAADLWDDMSVFKGYLAVAGGYTMMTILRPNFRKKLLQNIPDLYKVEMALAVGGYFVARSTGLAIGLDAWDATMMPLIAYVPFLRTFRQAGYKSDKRVGRMRRWADFAKGFDWARATGAGLTPYMFIYPMEQMSMGIETNGIGDWYMMNLGMAPVLLTLGVVQAMLAGYDLPSTIKAKVLKYPAHGSLGNVGKLFFGPQEIQGYLWEVLVKEGGLAAHISNVSNERTGSAAQYDALLRLVMSLEEAQEQERAEREQAQVLNMPAVNVSAQDVEDTETGSRFGAGAGPIARRVMGAASRLRDSWRARRQSSEEDSDQTQMSADSISETDRLRSLIEEMVVQAGRRWSFTDPLRARNLAQLFPPLVALVSSVNVGGDPGFQTLGNARFFRTIILRMLLDKTVSSEMIAALLDSFRVMLSRTDGVLDRSDVQRNLFYTVNAARQGPHGQAIQSFLKQNAWMFKCYGVSVDDEPLNRWRGFAAVAWFKKRITGSTNSSDGIVSRPYLAMNDQDRQGHDGQEGRENEYYTSEDLQSAQPQQQAAAA